MTRLASLTVLFAASIMLVTAPALAGKGGNGKASGKPGGDTTTSRAWVSASPNPAAASGTRVELNGCGYDVNYPAEVRIVHAAGYTESYGVAVWYTGCLNPTPFLTREPGTYTIQVYQRQRQVRKGMLLKASAPLTVVG